MLIKGEKLENGKISRTRHFTNSNDSGQLSLVGWTIPVQIEIEEDGEKLTCERNVNETDKDGKKLFTWIGEFDVEIPRKPAGCLDIELTMSINEDKSLKLTGKVNGEPINTNDIKWNF